MKKIYLTPFILIFVISSFISAQEKDGSRYLFAANDSLLFDGEGNTNFFDKAFDDCIVDVLYIRGNATGTRIYSIIVKTCGVKDTVNRMEKGKVKKNDKLRAGDLMTTGPDTFMEIRLSGGKLIRFSPNTSLSINENYCKDNSHTQVDLKEGEIYVDDKPGSKDKSVDVTTKYGTAVVEGTQFTCGTTISGNDTTDILKVYEGTVSFRMMLKSGANKKINDKGTEMKKAYDDYQSGRISSKDYAKTIEDLSKELTDATPKLPISVNAGYQSRILNSANPTEPEIIDGAETHWWEGPNFQ